MFPLVCATFFTLHRGATRAGTSSPSGTARRWRGQSWRHTLYAACGPFGCCDGATAGAVPTCKCPDGFEPNGTSSGCTRKQPLRCGDHGDYFATLPGVKTPAMPVFVRNTSFDSCTAECRSNCSCTAISGGDQSSCLLWFGQLVDIAKDVNIDGENLYLRLAGSSTGSTHHRSFNLISPAGRHQKLATTIHCREYVCRSKEEQ